MPKVKLDAQFCLTATCAPGKKKVDYYDTSTTGFVLEVRSTGGRTFYLRYFDAHGRQRQHKIGAYGAITYADALKAAKRLRSSVTLGGDPASTKAELRAVPTFNELSVDVLAHMKTYMRSYDNTKGYFDKHLKPKWGKLRLTEIHQQDIAKWLAEMADEGFAPATVLKMRMFLQRAFELALKWDTPGLTKNPCKGLPNRPLNNARTRFLSAAEAERLRKAVEASPNKQLKHIVGLLLLCGFRVSELLTARWEHIDLERRQFLVPMSKSGRARHVPLSQAAIDIIQALPKFDKCPYLVPNPKTKLPFVSIKRVWAGAIKQANLPGLRIHDLRHSCASLMINSGIDLYSVSKILGHADFRSTTRYSHVSNDTLLAAVEAGASKLQGAWA